MAKYTVHMISTVSTWIDVEADSLDDAEETAYMEHAPRICAQCSSGPSGWGRHSDRGGIELAGDWEVNAIIDEEGNDQWDS